jgi:hypothetical protein
VGWSTKQGTRHKKGCCFHSIFCSVDEICNSALVAGFNLVVDYPVMRRNNLALRKRFLLTSLLSIGILLLVACPPRERIAKINRDPGRYAGKEVTIAGRVVDSYGALGHGAFLVDDGTGSMWVLAGQYGVPGAGAKLAVTGRIEQGFTLGGRNFATILRETERRH